MAHLEVYKRHFEKLISCLPMDDSLFMSQLRKQRLLPGDTEFKIKALCTQTDKASYFLSHVIKPALDIDDNSSFGNLLSIMEKSEYSHITRLVHKINSELSDSKADARKSDLTQFNEDDRPSFKDLHRHIIPRYSSQWKMLGYMLDLSSSSLVVIDHNNVSSEDCCREMLMKWLENDPDATWGKLLQTVESLSNRIGLK